MKRSIVVSTVIGLTFGIAGIYSFYTFMLPTLPWLGLFLAVSLFALWYAIFCTLQRYFD